MNKTKRIKVIWYVAAVICIAIALWSINYIGFLAMESARTYANQSVIQERYHMMLFVLVGSVIGSIGCFVKARRTKLVQEKTPGAH